MAVLESDLLYYGALLLPANNTDPVGGGIDTSNQFTGNGLNELMLTQGANPAGQADISDFAKQFVKNTNNTNNLTKTVIYIENHLRQATSPGVFNIVSDSVNDDSSKMVRLKFKNSVSDNIQEDVVLNGITAVLSVGQVAQSTNVTAELLTVTGETLTTASGNILITRGITLGMIPKGLETAQGNFSFAIESTLDGTGQADNRLTSPNDGGATPIDLTYYQTNTYEAGIPIANSGTLTHGTSQGIWVKRICYNGEVPISFMQCGLTIEGTAL